MTTPRLALGAAALALGLATPGLSQDMAAYEAANDAAIAAWAAMPMAFQTAVFIEEEAAGFGLFQPRETSVFAPGEPMIVYAEPMGFGWQENADNTYSYGVEVDLILRNPAGEELIRQDEFQRVVVTSRRRNREFFITLTLDLSNAPQGDYILEYVVHDLVDEHSATISLPFTLVAG